MRTAILLLFLAFGSAAQEPRQMLRSRVSPEGAVMVGEPVRLTVDVLVTTWLTGAPEFPRLEIPGAVVVLPEDRPLNLTETIEGQNWFGLRRSYLIYPQESRLYETPPAKVTVKFGGGPGSPAVLPIPTQRFSATIPAEAAALGYFIPTTRFRMTQQLSPESADLNVGDSISRTITMTADGAFAMFLPPIEAIEQPGLAAYPDPPRVEDLSEDRGGFQTGRRTDSVTYLIEQDGSYELPPITVSWWDLNANRLREATVPAVTFDAAPNPDQQPEIAVPVEPVAAEDTPPPPSTLKRFLADYGGVTALAMALLIALILAARRVVPIMQDRLAEHRRRRRESETAAFASILAACRRDDRAAVIRTLYIWLDRLDPSRTPGPATFASLAAASQELQTQSALLFAGDPTWHAPTFAAELQRLRRHHRPESTGTIARTLPPLNPGRP